MQNNIDMTPQWDITDFMDKNAMEERIKKTISRPSWRHSIFLIKELGIPFKDLKVAEVGCGTGTASLILAHFGAPVTLIDNENKVLCNAGEIFNLYGYQPNLIMADCLKEPAQELRGKFDVVCSGGLAEHFQGEDRLKCIAFHKLLLKKGGLCLIGVPNKFSFFLQAVVYFRKLTGTWNIALEVPFTYCELNAIARRVGFRKVIVIGSENLRKDAIVYLLGFISAIMDLVPKNIRHKFRNYKRNVEKSIKNKFQDDSGWNVKDFCYESLKSSQKVEPRNKISHALSSGLILIAYNEE